MPQAKSTQAPAKAARAKPVQVQVMPKAKAAVKGKAKVALKSQAVSKTKPQATAKQRTVKTKPRVNSASTDRTKKTAPPRRRTEIQEQPFAGDTVLMPEDTQPMLSTGTGAAWDFNPDPEIVALMAEEQNEENGGDELADDLLMHTSTSPILSGGDVDAEWEGANTGGEETVGGDAPTPDQDRVDELGEAAGLTYQDEEPLDTAKKLEKRDTDRWELDPVSAHRPK